MIAGLLLIASGSALTLAPPWNPDPLEIVFTADPGVLDQGTGPVLERLREGEAAFWAANAEWEHQRRAMRDLGREDMAAAIDLRAALEDFRAGAGEPGPVGAFAAERVAEILSDGRSDLHDPAGARKILEGRSEAGPRVLLAWPHGTESEWSPEQEGTLRDAMDRAKGTLASDALRFLLWHGVAGEDELLSLFPPLFGQPQLGAAAVQRWAMVCLDRRSELANGAISCATDHPAQAMTLVEVLTAREEADEAEAILDWLDSQNPPSRERDRARLSLYRLLRAAKVAALEQTWRSRWSEDPPGEATVSAEALDGRDVQNARKDLDDWGTMLVRPCLLGPGPATAVNATLWLAGGRVTAMDLDGDPSLKPCLSEALRDLRFPGIPSSGSLTWRLVRIPLPT